MFNRRNRNPENQTAKEIRKYDPTSISGKFEDIILEIGDRMLSPYAFTSESSSIGIDLTSFDDLDRASFNEGFTKAIQASVGRFSPTMIIQSGREIRSDFDHYKLTIDGYDYDTDDIALLSLNGIECGTDSQPELNLRLRLIDKYGESRDVDNVDIETLVNNIHNIV